MSAESAPPVSSKEQSQSGGVIQSAGEMLKAIGTDKSVQRTVRKMGEHGLEGAGITKKHWLTRKTTIQKEGVINAVTDPGLALQGAREKTRGDVRKLAFFAGRTVIRSGLARFSARGNKAPAMRPESPQANQAEATPASTVTATPLAAESNLAGTGQNTLQGSEVTFSSSQTPASSGAEFSASPFSDSTANIPSAQTNFDPSLKGVQQRAEHVPTPQISTTAR